MDLDSCDVLAFLKSPCRGLTMTIWAQESEILSNIVLIVAINVI